jgi:hypothetical protein
MDVPSIDQEVIGGVWRISKSQLADAFPAAIGHCVKLNIDERSERKRWRAVVADAATWTFFLFAQLARELCAGDLIQ